MVNVLYDFNFGSPFVPYIGAGAGYVLVGLAKAAIGQRPDQETPRATSPTRASPAPRTTSAAAWP